MTEFRITSQKGWNTEKNGQHSTEIHFALLGEHGAMVWQLSTGIAPEGKWPSSNRDGPLLHGVNLGSPMGMGLFAHAELNEKTATETEYSINDSCEYLDGRACVCNYARYVDKDLMQAFACEGFDGVRAVLEKEYKEHYGA
jgi:hypothetical protein